MSTDWKSWIAIGVGVAVLALGVWGFSTLARSNAELTAQLEKLQRGFEEFTARSDGRVADRLESILSGLQEIRNGQTGMDSRLSSLENALSERRFSATERHRVLPGRERVLVLPRPPQFIEPARAARAVLGVRVQDVTPELAKALELKEARGALITEVLPDSAAEQAGLRRRDVVVRLNDQAVRDGDHLGELVRARKPGDGVRLTVFRDGKKQVFRAVLATWKGLQLRLPREGEELDIPFREWFPR